MISWERHAEYVEDITAALQQLAGAINTMTNAHRGALENQDAPQEPETETPDEPPTVEFFRNLALEMFGANIQCGCPKCKIDAEKISAEKPKEDIKQTASAAQAAARPERKYPEVEYTAQDGDELDLVRIRLPYHRDSVVIRAYGPQGSGKTTILKRIAELYNS